jgi:hypothetical protein
MKPMVSGIDCLGGLTLFQLTALTRNTCATHMKQGICAYVRIRLETMQADLTAETDLGQCAVC